MRKFISKLLVAAVLASVCSVSPAEAAEIKLQPPTDRVVVDPFRAPSSPYGAGNRGLEYDTTVGDSLLAAGPGVVVFAGLVAGTQHVTIDHGGELLSSYSFVDRVLVHLGDEIVGGEVIAIAGDRFHFGTRIEGRYVDPESLFGVRTVSVMLVAHDDPEALWAWLDLRSRSEAIEIRNRFDVDSAGGRFGMINGVRRAINSIPFQPWLRFDPEGDLADLFHKAGVLTDIFMEIEPSTALMDLTVLTLRAIERPPCTEGSVSVAVPAERRLAVVVDGLDSSSAVPGAMAGLDLESHGYDTGDIVRFSYNGGVVPSDARPGSWSAQLDSSPYSGSDTRQEIVPAVERLTELLEAVAAANPGVVIDVYGHSLGGLMTRHAVAAVGGDGGRVDVGVVVTFAAPNHGAPLAETAQVIAMTSPGSIAYTVIEPVWPDFILVADVVDDVSPSGFAGSTAGVAYPEGVTAVSVGARFDWVVPASMTGAPGSRNVIIGDSPDPGIHSELPGLAESDREVSLALGGFPPACESVMNRLADGLVSVGIERFEHGMAASILIGDTLLTKG